MGGSFRIGRVAGIGIFIHWTFLVLIAWIFIVNLPSGTVASAATRAAFLLALFGCVLLHELGHALTARAFGIATRDITLLPIGGVARLERIPEKPTQELLITINGPLVNAVIAGVIFIGLALSGQLPPLPTTQAQAERMMVSGGFLFQLMQVNIFLMLFNLLPAFPMDGGRIVRAVLAYFLPYPTATRAAARVGQVMAVLFALAGIFGGNFMLLLIALFVFFGAEAEARATSFRSAFAGLRVRDGMMTSFQALSESDTLAQASSALLAGSQQDFPVIASDGSGLARVVGILPRSELFRTLAESGPAAPVAQAIVRDCPLVSPGDAIEEVYPRMRDSGCGALPVVEGGRLVGLLTTENLTELVAVRDALSRSRGGAPPPRRPAPAPAVRPHSSTA